MPDAKKKYEDAVRQIIAVNQKLENFWAAGAKGWAPKEAVALLSKSRLDRQVALSHSLMNWAHLDDKQQGDLILAWANLGALTEGSLKFFLSVWYRDYRKDVHRILEKNGNLIEPDSLFLEKLRQFFTKRDLIPEESLAFIALVQQRRNAIHAYQDREIGNFQDFVGAVKDYLDLVEGIDSGVPYPF